MSIQVAASELDIRAQVKRADGTWQRDRQVWSLRYDQVVALGLEGRISDCGRRVYILRRAGKKS